VDREIVKKMLMEADPAVLSQYLVYMKEARLCCEPVIEFMLNTHNDALTNLKLANKCEDGEFDVPYILAYKSTRKISRGQFLTL